MSSNVVLNKSKYCSGNDEFYTTYETIEKELTHYKTSLFNKTIYCNCDDPLRSNFSLYFIKNFNKLNLKSLICTSFNHKGKGFFLSLQSVPSWINDKTSSEEIIEFLNNHNIVKKLHSNGDFRCQECVSLLKLSDVVITNPPFSLFREWIDLVVKYSKQFLVIGNSNALSYKNIFPLIQNNKVWIGNTFGEMKFRVPNYYEPKKYRYWVDEHGQKWRSIGNAMWLTNIDFKRRHTDLELCRSYSPDIYQTYDNYDAIEVPKVVDIPKDFDGIMGVPITFLNKHNPAQFDIVGEANHGSDNAFDLFKPLINGNLKFKRILIKKVAV